MSIRNPACQTMIRYDTPSGFSLFIIFCIYIKYLNIISVMLMVNLYTFKFIRS